VHRLTADYQSRSRRYEHFPTVEFARCWHQSRRDEFRITVEHQYWWWWLETCRDSATSHSAWTKSGLSQSSQPANRELSHPLDRCTAECSWHTVSDAETVNDVCDRWHLEREQRRNQDGSWRNVKLAKHGLISLSTDRDELWSVTQYELSHYSSHSEIPKFSSSRDINVLWSIVSDRSHWNNSALDFYHY